MNDLKASGGFDEPEYSLDAIHKTLNFLDPDGLTAMTRGSQMIVITDATSKNPNLVPNIIRIADDIGVCIHFFISDGGVGFEPYNRIVEGTSGTLTSSYSDWDITTFTSSYRDSPCKHEVSRRKRAAIITRSASRCQSFHISELSILFRFSGKTDLNVILTRPSGTTIEILGGAGVALHSERYPEPGEWLACLSSGDLEFSVNQDYSLDATLGYLKKTTTGTIIASISSPTECKEILVHRITAVTQDSPYMLQFVDLIHKLYLLGLAYTIINDGLDLANCIHIIIMELLYTKKQKLSLTWHIACIIIIIMHIDTCRFYWPSHAVHLPDFLDISASVVYVEQ